MIELAIVEDDAQSREHLKKCLEEFFGKKQIPISVTAFPDAVSFLKTEFSSFNLIFLDIDLPNLSGMKAAEEIRKKDKEIMIIFVTSLAQFAIDGYKVHAFDYIVKPFNYFAIEMSLNRALPSLETKDKNIVISKTDRTKTIIKVADLIYVEVMNHTLYFHTKDQVIPSNDTLERCHQTLEPLNFALCNRCYLVNLRHVAGIQQNIIRLSDGNELAMSRYKKQSFLDALNLYLSQKETN